MKIRVVCVVCVLCVLLVGLTSCFEEDSKELQEKVILMIDALITDNYEAAYGMVKEVASEEEFSDIYYGMKELLGETETYTLKMVGLNSRIGGGVKTFFGTFGLYTNHGNFVIEASISSDVDGLSSFSVTRDDDNFLPAYKSEFGEL